jgi:hypothetical protein
MVAESARGTAIRERPLASFESSRESHLHLRAFSLRKPGAGARVFAVTQSFEILGKFDREGDCHKLLYAPLAQALTYRESTVYKVDFEGDDGALKAFVGKVLLDPISQALRDGATPAFDKAAFVLEYGMKGGALDLEKEMILSYYRSLQEPGFDLKKLVLRKRIYVFGEGATSAPFVRDICNPAIHTWEVKQAA